MPQKSKKLYCNLFIMVRTIFIQEKSLEEFEPEKCKEDGEENRKVLFIKSRTRRQQLTNT